VRGIYRLRQSAARRQLARALSPAARAMRRDAADQGHPPARRPARPRRRPRRRAARRSKRACRARDDRRPRAERPRPGVRDGQRGALPPGRRHRRRLRSGARARGDVAQDRGAAPRARRRDGPQLRAVLVWLNGRLVDGARAHVSAFDRGLLHGDGAYDTWRTYAGRPFAVPAHVRRLAAAARALALPGPGAAALWERRTRVLVARPPPPDAALRLTLTRRATGDGLVHARRGRPTLLLAA